MTNQSGVKSNNDGKDFEQLNFIIQKSLKGQSDLKIFHNHKIADELGILRQFDVFIECVVNGFTLKIGIECKDRGRNVILGDIGEFLDRCKSCRVSKAIMVSSKGFSKDVIKRAKLEDIELYTFSDINQSVIQSWMNLDDLKFSEVNYNIDKVFVKLLDNDCLQAGTEILPYSTTIFLENNRCSLAEILQQYYNDGIDFMQSYFEKLRDNDFAIKGRGNYEYSACFAYAPENGKIPNIQDTEGYYHPIIEFKYYIKANAIELGSFNIKRYSKLQSDRGILTASIETEKFKIVNVLNDATVGEIKSYIIPKTNNPLKLEDL